MNLNAALNIGTTDIAGGRGRGRLKGCGGGNIAGIKYGPNLGKTAKPIVRDNSVSVCKGGMFSIPQKWIASVDRKLVNGLEVFIPVSQSDGSKYRAGVIYPSNLGYDLRIVRFLHYADCDSVPSYLRFKLGDAPCAALDAIEGKILVIEVEAVA